MRSQILYRAAQGIPVTVLMRCGMHVMQDSLDICHSVLAKQQQRSLWTLAPERC